MKKVINGKAYDTEKAKPVAHWKNWGSWRDFEHIEETLYRKRTGEFFLFGEGGPKTKYAEQEGQNCWTGGSKIIPLSWEAARKWAEEHLDADEYAEIFEVEEDDEKAILSISISSAVAEHARSEAAKAGISLSDYIASKL